MSDEDALALRLERDRLLRALVRIGTLLKYDHIGDLRREDQLAEIRKLIAEETGKQEEPKPKEKPPE